MPCVCNRAACIESAILAYAAPPCTRRGTLGHKSYMQHTWTMSRRATVWNRVPTHLIQDERRGPVPHALGVGQGGGTGCSALISVMNGTLRSHMRVDEQGPCATSARGLCGGKDVFVGQGVQSHIIRVSGDPDPQGAGALAAQAAFNRRTN